MSGIKRKRTEEEKAFVDLIEFMKDWGYPIHEKHLENYERIIEETEI